jgi:ABC-type polysaccharide/polyol phosphate transport system ATPase subunit
MQVRLAYAIAIQVDFDVLLLDEVLAVGDESFQQKCFGTFDRFREEGKTVVLVTHSLRLIERFADRALLLFNGRVRGLGPPSEVIARYYAELDVSAAVGEGVDKPAGVVSPRA